MERILIFDTSLVTENLGDFIVMDYCNKVLNSLFPEDFIIKVPTHERISKVTYQYAKNSKYKLVCGTNLLTGEMRKHNQWKLTLRDALELRDVCLLGVGWRKYEEDSSSYSKWLWNKVLSHDLIHSVRDEYTANKLNQMGFDNVINTGCPTMWALTPDHCKKIPTQKASKVLMTTTRYNKNIKSDNLLLDILLSNYKKVYFWIQSYEDYHYAYNLKFGNKLIFVGPKLALLDNILMDNDLDYCGTRLHAGIRALNKMKRTIIIATDNRAIEIAKDTNIPICRRENLKDLDALINCNFNTKIRLPQKNIDLWLNQFKK